MNCSRKSFEVIRYDEYLRAEGVEGVERIENVKELITGAAELVSDEEGGSRPHGRSITSCKRPCSWRSWTSSARCRRHHADDAATMQGARVSGGLHHGLEDGLFPLAKAFDDPALLEEERRLFYVGITRAERKLIITYAEERRRNGEFMPSKPSSFLTAIPEDMLEQRKTVKVRSSASVVYALDGGGSRWGQSRRTSTEDALRSAVVDADSPFPPSAAQRTTRVVRLRQRRLPMTRRPRRMPRFIAVAHA